MAFDFNDSAAVASDFGQMDLLSSQEMVATEGELAPLFWVGYIGGIATLDFAIQGYFYGVYMPWWQRYRW